MRRILIADDSEVIRVFYETFLKRDYELKTVESGEEALELLKNEDEEFDLFLFDFEMGGITGAELTEETKKIEKYKNIPVIICSAFSNDINKSDAKESGVTAWLEKPVTMEGLKTSIESVLDPTP